MGYRIPNYHYTEEELHPARFEYLTLKLDSLMIYMYLFGTILY